MNIRLKNGLIAGVTGAVLTLCLGSAISGLCGPVAAVITGFLAGHFTARDENSPTRRAGARAGAVAGTLAGVVNVLGQVATGLGILSSRLGELTTRGTMPELTGEPAMLVVYYVAGLTTHLFLGLVGVVGAASAGAMAGYWRDPEARTPGGAVLTGPKPITSPWRDGAKFGVLFGGAISLLIHGGTLSFIANTADFSRIGSWLMAAAFSTLVLVGIFTVAGAGVSALAIWLSGERRR
jgi:hypothetical protein